ncbi:MULTISPECIES: hypothetical protein [unclassified Streptomyces]|uniref:hypothetical protein n=1 Tax=unclassified Streptomyces TaxID=2593676 RepID=UPI00093A2B78|nr:hypothetical protein [Streptomyces sp. TSRI0107]OKJ84102.1 hypothetical protein AMK31_18485 [Streptomyces sp. TSRI0107]
MVSDAVVVGILTFIGTALATGAGFWQWQRTQAREARATFRTQRVDALREVWEALSSFEEAQRMSIAHPDAATEPETGRLAQINLLLLRRSPFLRSDEQEWAQAFAQRLTEIDALLRAGLNEGRPTDSEWWATSRELPPATHVASTAAYQLRTLRDKLGERYAAVMQGEHE